MAETTTSIQRPWDVQAQHLRNIFDRAGMLAGQPAPGYFPGQTFAGFAPQQEAAMGLTQQRAMGGSPYEQGFQNYLTQTFAQPQIGLQGSEATANLLQGGAGAGQAGLMSMAGGGANPYLDAMYGGAARGLTTQFQEATMPGIQAAFGAGGRTGSGAHQQALGTAQQQLGTSLGDLAANIYGGAYESDAQRRLQASQSLQAGALGGVGAIGDLYGAVDQAQARAGGLSPVAQGMEYQNLDRLYGVGQNVQDLANQQIQDQMARYQYYTEAPWQQLGRYHNLVGGQGYGGTTTVTGPNQGPSRGQAAFGGAATGAGIGSAFGPWGTAIGAGLGGLGGLIFGG